MRKEDAKYLSGRCRSSRLPLLYLSLCSLLLCSLLLSACNGDDDYHYPSVKLEFLTAYSDAGGTLKSIRTDAGEVFPVVAMTSPIALTPDSVYRIVTNYEPATASDGTTGVKLYAWSNAVSPLPKPVSEFEEGVKTLPAEVVSIWKGYEYLNILLEVSQQGKHTLGFVEDEVTTDAAEGRTTVHLSLYHDATSEVMDYAKRAYLSIPLWQYQAESLESLTICFTLQTNAGEEKTYSFDY